MHVGGREGGQNWVAMRHWDTYHSVARLAQPRKVFLAAVFLAMTTHERDPLHARYNIRTERLLGKGADGGVLRGYHRSTGVFRALKFQSRTAWSADRELEALRAMSHPNVVSLVEWFEPTGNGRRPQRVLVFAETDTDLFGFLGRHRSAVSQGERFGCAALRDWTMQLVSATRHVHVAGYVHRDIKPDNILISFACDTAQSTPLRMILADFGRAASIEHCLGTTRTPTQLDLDYNPSGRPGAACYSAPELLLDARAQYGAAVDVWTLGAVLFELYTDARDVFGMPPGELPAESLERIAFEAYRHRLGPPLALGCHPRLQFRDVFSCPLPSMDDIAFMYAWEDVVGFSPLAVLRCCLQWEPGGRQSAESISLTLEAGSRDMTSSPAPCAESGRPKNAGIKSEPSPTDSCPHRRGDLQPLAESSLEGGKLPGDQTPIIQHSHAHHMPHQSVDGVVPEHERGEAAGAAVVAYQFSSTQTPAFEETFSQNTGRKQSTQRQDEFPGRIAGSSLVAIRAESPRRRPRWNVGILCKPALPCFTLSPWASSRRACAGNSTCRCKGACGKFSHRKGCDSFEVLPEIGLCLQCVCVACDSSRDSSIYCYKHREGVKGISWALQITSHTRHFVTDLIPSDVTDFIAQSRDRLFNFAALDTMAMVKIPVANTRWNGSVDTSACTEQEFADSLFAVAAIGEADESTPSRAAESRMYHSQWGQLSRQGAARFTGLPVLCSSLQLVRAAPRPCSSSAVRVLRKRSAASQAGSAPPAAVSMLRKRPAASQGGSAPAAKVLKGLGSSQNYIAQDSALYIPEVRKFLANTREEQSNWLEILRERDLMRVADLLDGIIDRVHVQVAAREVILRWLRSSPVRTHACTSNASCCYAYSRVATHRSIGLK